MTTAILLAGDRGEGDALASSENVELKAFIDIHGRSMIDHVAQTLVDTDMQDIIICLPDSIDLHTQAPLTDSLLSKKRAIRMNQAEGPVESVMNGLNMTKGNPGVLVTTADHPLLTRETLRTFINQTQDGVSVGMVPLDLVRQKWPKSKRTALKFSDGQYSGANLFFFKGPDAKNILSFWKNLQKHRKNPISMAARIGFGPLFAYLCGRLSLEDTFEAIGKKANVTIKPIILNDPYAAVDVDKPEDLELVREIWPKNKIE